MPIISPVTAQTVQTLNGATPPAAQTPGMGPAMQYGQQMYQAGGGLLGQPVSGNGFGTGQFGGAAANGYGTGQFGTAAGNGFGQVSLNQTTLNNPFVSGMVRDIRNQTNDMLGSAMLGIQGNSVASGGLGGSRQGVAQGIAAGRAADALSGNLSNMLGGLYEGQANRNLQQYGLDQNFYASQRGQDLQNRGTNMQFFGQQRGQDLQNRGQNMDFYTAQRGQDLAQMGLGSNLVQQGLNTQWLPIQNATNAYSPFTGFGSTTQSQQSGGGWQGALGGGLGVLGLGSQLGWWGSGS
jgi:hypothetical protein